MRKASHDYVQTLKGQKLRFPDFDGLFSKWPKGINPHYEALRDVQNAKLAKLFGPGPRLKALIDADCAYNAATWWPTSNFDALQLVCAFVAFLYVWDDEIDSPEFSNLSSDWNAGEKFRAATRKHMNFYLDGPLRPEQALKSEDVPICLASFNPVGEAAAFRMTPGQRRLFLQENLRYVDAVGLEQKSELSGQAPTLKEYLPVRMGTSGVAAISACIEYMTCIDLSDSLREDPDISNIHNQVNMIISITNDLFSLRRELQFPFYNNAIAVLYHENQDLQVAVNKAYDLVARAVDSLEASEKAILARYPERCVDLRVFVNGAKTMCTGNIAWSMRIKRYDLDITQCDGKTEIVI